MVRKSIQFDILMESTHDCQTAILYICNTYHNALNALSMPADNHRNLQIENEHIYSSFRLDLTIFF